MANNEYLELLAPGELERLKEVYAYTKDLGDLIVEVNGKLKGGEGSIMSASKVSETNKAIQDQVLTMKDLVAMEKELQKEADNYIKFQVQLEKQAQARAKAEQAAAEEVVKATQKEIAAKEKQIAQEEKLIQKIEADQKRRLAASESEIKQILKEEAARDKADAAYQKQIERQASANEKRLVAIQAATEKEVQAVFDAENAYKRLETVVKINTEEGKRLAAQHGLMSNEFLKHEAATSKYRVQLMNIDKTLQDGRKNVGNYASSMFELTQVVRELPSAANGLPIFLQAIGNNLPQLQQKFIEVRKEAGSTGKALGIFATSLFSMSNIFTLAMSAIIIGVSYFARYSKETKTATKEVNEFEKAQKDLATTIGKEIGQLQTLAATAANTNLTYKERGDAVDKLQKEYPNYFSNLEREKILNGEVANEINKATDAIMRNARTKALQGKLEKEYAGLIEAQLELQKLQNNDQNTFNYAGEERIKYLKDEQTFRQANIDAIAKQIQAEKGYEGEVVYFLDERSRKEYEALRAKEKSNALLTEKERKELDKRAKDYEEYLKKIADARENIKNIAKSTNALDTSQSLDPYAQAVGNEAGSNKIFDAILKAKGKAMQAELDAQEAANNTRSLGVENSYLAGLYKTYEDYEKAKTDAVAQGAKERFEIEKRYLQQFIDLLPIDSAERAKYQKQLSEFELKFKQQLSNDKTKEDKKYSKNSIKDEKTRLQNIKKISQEIYSGIADLFSEIGNTLSATTNARLAALEAQADQIEKNGEIEIAKIQRSKQTAEQKEEAIRYQEGLTANARKAIELEQLQAKQRQARFDKIANIANIIARTALAVITAFTEGDPYTKIPRAAIAGAAGAASLATALQAPVPQYAHGTANHKGGLFVAGEAGERELVQHPDGTAYWTDNKAGIFDAPRGTRVIPESRLAASVANMGMANLMKREQAGNVFDTSKIEREIRKKNMNVTTIIHITDDKLKARASHR